MDILQKTRERIAVIDWRQVHITSDGRATDGMIAPPSLIGRLTARVREIGR